MQPQPLRVSFEHIEKDQIADTIRLSDKREAVAEPQIDHLLRYWRKRDAEAEAEPQIDHLLRYWRKRALAAEAALDAQT